MNNEVIVAARKAAERAVEDMPSGPFKIAAFQTILEQLLQRAVGTTGAGLLAVPAGKTQAKRRSAGQRTQGTTGRLVTLIEEGVFDQQRSLADIRQTLSDRGWHYQLEDLGTPVTRLVRRKYLRRTQVSENGKKIWKYSNA